MLPGQQPRYLSRTFHLVFLTTVALLLAACNLPRATPTPTPASTDTVTPLVNLPTATFAPSPSLTPTATSNSTGPINIVFATGATAAVETGTLQPGQIQTYTINAGAAQPMVLLLRSNRNAAYLAVYEADGSVLLDPAKKWNSWQWLLPKTEQYTIKVIAGGTASEDFALTVKVAARITFGAGATSAAVTGSTVGGYVISYAVSAAADQTLTANLTVPAGSAVMDIFGLATGDSLLGISDKSTTFTGTLPATQDYIIEIFPTNGEVVNYSLTVTIH